MLVPFCFLIHRSWNNLGTGILLSWARSHYLTWGITNKTHLILILVSILYSKFTLTTRSSSFTRKHYIGIHYSNVSFNISCNSVQGLNIFFLLSWSNNYDCIIMSNWQKYCKSMIRASLFFLLFLLTLYYLIFVCIFISFAEINEWMNKQKK